MANKGLLLVVSGASGAGKGTLCHALVQKRTDTWLSVSATTRKPRPGEVEGESYYFLEEAAFRSMIDEGGFIEWACFCDNYYGTPKACVEEQLAAGRNVILEIEVQGAMQVRSEYPEAVFVFVMTPTWQELKKRLTGRGTEAAGVIEQRLERARQEFSYIDKYNYIVINDTIEQAAERFGAIIEAEKMRTERSGDVIRAALEA